MEMVSCYGQDMRERKRHVQVELPLVPKRRGGKRKGAGRPPKGFRSSERHKMRARFDRLTAVHVTLRLIAGYGTLRRRDTYLALRKATRAVLGRSDFRIVHLSPERDHIHMIVEAETNGALARGVQAFEISAAQHLNRAIGRRTGKQRRGSVFADRYHARILRSPTQVRNAINYVLNNWRRHGEDEGWDIEIRSWDVDYLSSAPSFTGWKELADRPLRYEVPPDLRLCVTPPQSWLLSVGWQKAGPISMYAVPGPRR